MPKRFILDSGCSVHMIVDKQAFIDLSISNQNKLIQTAKKDVALLIEGTGKVALATKDANLILSNATWVPESTINLISLGALMTQGACLSFDSKLQPSMFYLSSQGKFIISGQIINNLFIIDMSTEPKQAYYSSAELLQIHRSLGHASIDRMEQYLKVTIPASQKHKFECLSCDKSKITQKPFNSQQQAANRPFERIHIDLMGPINPMSKGGF